MADARPDQATPKPMQRSAVAVQPAEPGWWLATDGLWYPPEAMSATQAPSGPAVQAVAPPTMPIVAAARLAGAPLAPAPNAQFVHAGFYAPTTMTVVNAPKSKIAAGLLGIFLGALGIHRFYLGYTGIGVVMLLLSLLSLGILAPIVSLWGFIEGVVILCGGMNRDARGMPLA